MPPPTATTTTTTPDTYKFLTPSQVTHFLNHGYIRIPNAFTPQKAADWTSTLWPRLGYSPTDKSTWLTERVNMPTHKTESVTTFSPLAWGCMCELLGGEDRVDPESALWTDGFIINLGKEEFESVPEEDRKPERVAKTLDNWHVDGDFFVHFLDSPDQGLLVIPVFSDIGPGGGGTMIAPDGIKVMARYLMEHPEGVSPRMVPRGQKSQHEALGWFIEKVQKECNEFVEITGQVGDVVLMHPLMLHSASRNHTRAPRVITNPKVSLREPFCFDREDGNYSLVERKTLKELGVERLAGWKITQDREEIVPERVRLHRKMREEEERRLRGELLGGTRDRGTVDNDRAGETVVETMAGLGVVMV